MAQSKRLTDEQLLSGLAQDLHELVLDKDALRTAVDSFFNQCVDDLTLGIIFNVHRKYKTGVYELECEENERDDDELVNNSKKNQACICMYCKRRVAAGRFAGHLEDCMGLGKRSRKSRRRAATNANNTMTDGDGSAANGSGTGDKDSSVYIDLTSDDEKDMDWNSGNRRTKKRRRNGTKKARGEAADRDAVGLGKIVEL